MRSLDHAVLIEFCCEEKKKQRYYKNGFPSFKTKTVLKRRHNNVMTEKATKSRRLWCCVPISPDALTAERKFLERKTKSYQPASLTNLYACMKHINKICLKNQTKTEQCQSMKKRQSNLKEGRKDGVMPKNLTKTEQCQRIKQRQSNVKESNKDRAMPKHEKETE